MIDAAQSTPFIAAKKHWAAAMGTECIDNSGLAACIAKGNKVLPKQLQANGCPVADKL
jgi:hypothetical protein